ncbi:MAG: anti-sigma factor [Methylacidiphilales bacterium]|nr:anti-sigma factor [Candidatus Methylacidiphilales bacterium]
MNTENHCFCELAPLYVLDLLSEAERLWVEKKLAESPELRQELAQYETVITEIPYSLPILPMATNLKNKLFARLELEPVTPQANINTSVNSNLASSMTSVRMRDVQWQTHFVPGSEIAILYTDLIKREIVGLFRAIPGMNYAPHRHAATEEIYMLQGDLVIGDEVYGAYDYIRSEPGSTHTPYTNGGCMFFFRTSMDDEYPDLVEVGV